MTGFTFYVIVLVVGAYFLATELAGISHQIVSAMHP